MEKLAGAAGKGGTVLTGDAGDAEFLRAALRGADAVFALLPPDVHAADYRRQQDEQGEAIVAAIRDSGLRHVVFLSSVGADLAEAASASGCRSDSDFHCAGFADLRGARRARLVAAVERLQFFPSPAA